MKKENSMLLSIVIPVYNEEKRMHVSLSKVVDYVKKNGISDNSEIIVVNDGSLDNTVSVINQFKEDYNFIKLVDYKDNKGKGYAVKKGVLSAKGDYILFMDADLSTPLEEINKVIQFLDMSYDLSIGSRGLKDSKIIIRQPIYRRAMGKIFNLTVRLLLIKKIRDTQCGFKCFKKEIAREIFNQTKISGFCFDVEVLYIAQRKGYRIKEIPVKWYDFPDSKVGIFKDSLKMLIEIFKIKFINKYGFI